MGPARAATSFPASPANPSPRSKEGPMTKLHLLGIPARILVRGGRPLALLVALLGLLATGVPAQAAGPGFNPPKQYYLALGDSVTYGYQQVKFDSEYPHIVAGT